MLGAKTAVSQATATNQVVIGYGASGHGDNIAVIGNGDNTAIHPHDDNEVDLGSSSYEYKDLYIDGTANIDGLNISDGFGHSMWYSNDDISSSEVTIISNGSGDIVNGVLIDGIAKSSAGIGKFHNVEGVPGGEQSVSEQGVVFKVYANGSLTIYRTGAVTGAKFVGQITWF